MDPGIITMVWPACSLDVNTVENAWAWSIKEFNHNQRQFDNVNDLVEALFYTYD